MPLQFAEPITNPTLNILLYGESGTGKSTAALTAPAPIVYVNAEGPNSSLYARSMGRGDSLKEVVLNKTNAQQTLTDVMQHAQSTDAAPTYVLDTVGAAYQAVLENVARNDMKVSLPEHGDAGTHIERFCRFMTELPTVNFVATAHDLSLQNGEVLEKVPNTGTNKSPLAVPLMRRADVLGYCTVVKAEGKKVYAATLVPADGHHGKDRTGVLGELRVLNLAEWIDTYKKSLNGKAKA